MAKKKFIVLVAILAFAVVGYSSLTQVSAYYSSLNSVLYTAEGGHFQVLFPNQPIHTTDKIPFRSPTELVSYDSYIAKGDDQTMYLLTTAVYPISPDNKNAREYLQLFLQQVASNSANNAIIQVQEITFQNNPALDFTLRNFNFWTFGRTILAGNRGFILLCSNANGASAQQDFHTFADSLVIK
jgi:hypothetical protein